NCRQALPLRGNREAPHEQYLSKARRAQPNASARACTQLESSGLATKMHKRYAYVLFVVSFRNCFTSFSADLLIFFSTPFSSSVPEARPRQITWFVFTSIKSTIKVPSEYWFTRMSRLPNQRGGPYE